VPTTLFHRSLWVGCLAATLAFGNTAPASLSPSAPDGVGKDLAYETSAFMLDTAYRDVPHLYSDSAPDGAYGPVNRKWDAHHKGEWYIEEQRFGGDVVAGGIATKNTDAIDRGMLILNWGFAQQKPDSGFNSPDKFHSTSFFVEAAAHALLLLEASEYSARYSQSIADMKPKVHSAALWMTDPKNEIPGKKKNMPFTHRRYLVAAALGETGVLTSDSSLVRASEAFVRDGIALQSATGYNPERGGWDSSYHSKGMAFACRYYTIVADEDMKKELYPMMDKAMKWEASRVNDDGTVNTEGNTRVGGAKTETSRAGKPKTVEFRQVCRSLYYWSVISGDASYEKLAEKVSLQTIQ
jgi:hypothetical protein